MFLSATISVVKRDLGTFRGVKESTMLKENELLGLMLKRWKKFWSSVKEHRMHVWLREMQAWIWTILLSRRAEPKKTGSQDDGTELVRESLCFLFCCCDQKQYKRVCHLLISVSHTYPISDHIRIE